MGIHKCTRAVDCICRDSTSTQYMTMQKFSQICMSITMYHSSSGVFMTNKALWVPIIYISTYCTLCASQVWMVHDILFVVMMQAFETETLFIVRVGVAMCIKVGRGWEWGQVYSYKQRGGVIRCKRTVSKTTAMTFPRFSAHYLATHKGT